MAQKPVKRKYNFSDGTLGEVGDSLCVAAERDLADFAAYGYDQPRIDLIKQKILDFKDFAADEFYASMQMVATQAKNEAMEQMSEVAEGIVRRSVNKFGKDAPQVKGFGWTGYITQKDNDKTGTCRKVHKQGTALLAELASEGLTGAILTDLQNKIQAADAAITEKWKKVTERDTAVHDRILLGNSLYEDLVKLADTGKHIYEDTNESKYNDYIIYAGAGTGVQVVTGTVAGQTILEPSVVVDSGADTITISIPATGQALKVYFSDDPGDPPIAQAAVVQPGTVWTGTATSIGWTASNFRLLISNETNSDSEVEVRVS